MTDPLPEMTAGGSKDAGDAGGNDEEDPSDTDAGTGQTGNGDAGTVTPSRDGGTGGRNDAGTTPARDSGTADSSVPLLDGGPPDKPPVRVVGACDGLKGVNEFEEITPPGANGEYGVVQVLLDPVNSGTIYAGTDHKGLFKSTNCGATWTKVNTGRYASMLDQGILWSMEIDPVDPNVMYAGSLYAQDSSLLKSVNGGKDWDSVFPPGSEVYNSVELNFFQDLAINPSNHKHVVVTFHANCKGATGPGCMAETLDSGATWRLFKNPTGGWVEGAGPFVLDANRFLLGTTQNGIYLTEDRGATWKRVGPGANRDLYKNTAGDLYVGSDYGIQRSKDGGKTWNTVPNSPNGFGLIGDGKRMFISMRSAGDNQPYYTSAENDGNTWTKLKSPSMGNGAVVLQYDPDHKLLYSANTRSGLWRMVTQ